VQSLSWNTRIKGFAICFGLGAIFGVVSVIVFMTSGNLTVFAILYTFANIFALGSTIFLMGPLNQLKKMFAETRIIATIIFLIKIGILVLLFVILQFLALMWYTLSYIPFARNAVKSCCQGCLGV
ncbi:unnamed protein product, partial [Didymodactylos carnosus]